MSTKDPDNRCTYCLRWGHKAHNCPVARKGLITGLLLAASMAATASDGAASMRPDYLNVGGVSHHFSKPDRSTDYNELNLGLGLTWAERDMPIIGQADASVGVYRNSQRHVTAYAAVHKLPVQVLGARAGVTLGLATGYELAPLVPIVAPTACWRYVCALVTPPIGGKAAGAVALQFRIPL